MNKYQAVIFDWNGVLIDDEELHEFAFREVLRRAGGDLTHSDYVRCFAGRTDELGFEEYKNSKPFTTLDDVYNLIERKRKIYEEAINAKASFYPNAAEVVDKASISGMKIGIVTGSPLREVKSSIARLNTNSAPNVIISSDDIESSKPDPEGFLLAAKILHISPKNCLVIEDSPSGVKAAKQAGMYCIAITNTHSIEQLQGADSIVSSLDEIDLFHTPEDKKTGEAFINAAC
ncbi:MAG: HAD family phosphatase [Fimbriimonadaceae bacterium]